MVKNQHKWERYTHHNREVGVRSDLRGRHREHCLCYSCVEFEEGCEIAKQVFALCVEENLVLPVWECPSFTSE